jgi:type IV pilus assembly protein PilN
MIRINLLAPERAAAKEKKVRGPAIAPGAPGALQSYLLLVLFVGGALLVCAGLWWVQTAKLRSLDTRIAADEKRMRDLQAIKAQVDAFQQKKAMLENKVAVIEKLQLAQKSPVHMLDEISKALPDYVWLTDMDEATGSLKFKGQSNTLASVADFISALQRSGWFPTVDLVNSQDQNNLINFDLSGLFRDPEVAAKEQAAAEAAARMAPPPGARPPGARPPGAR